jgi:hypothetical protein
MKLLETARRLFTEKPSAARILRGLERRGRGAVVLLRWQFDGEFAANRRRLNSFRNKHLGERCVIVGNGPSLNDTNLDLLGETATFGLNRIYLLFERTRFRPTYICCFNDTVLSQFHGDLSQAGYPLFVNARAHEILPPSERVLLVPERFTPGFRTTPLQGVWGGATVTFVALQLAYFMGFRRVVLVGVDHSFAASGEAHRKVRAEKADIDHFDPRYFGQGIFWDLPDLATSEWAYQMAREAFEADGRTIVDATVGGKLQVFPKVDFDEEFGG